MSKSVKIEVAPPAKCIVVVGPTASGKSALAVELAKKFNGEIISADSRQVYKDLDIGTGKITKKEMSGVPHHLLDVAEPRNTFTVGMFKKQAEEALADTTARGKLPIICGGTGFYIEAVVDGIDYPAVPADVTLRKQFQGKTAQELFVMLKEKDSARAKTIDPKNKVRLIRALEIAATLGKVPKPKKKKSSYEFLQVGIVTEPAVLKQKIFDRLAARVAQGMIEEVARLHEKGLSWKRMRELGLEYRFLADHLSGKLERDEMFQKLTTAIWHYAKRQMTWFKRDARIKWFRLTKKEDLFLLAKTFLDKECGQ